MAVHLKAYALGRKRAESDDWVNDLTPEEHAFLLQVEGVTDA